MTAEYLAGDFGGMIRQAADGVLSDAGSCPHVVIGPVVWEPIAAGRQWYFVIASGSPDGFRVDRLAADDKPLAERARAALLIEMMQRRPVVVHDMADELDMARWCAAIWPGQKTAAILASIEGERGARH